MTKEHVLKGSLKKLPRWAAYDGNPTVKKAYVNIEYDEHQISELAKCSQDLVYFAENYIHIIDPDHGKVLVHLRDYQKEMLVHFANNRFSVVLASRQIGKSTIAAIYIVHYLLFNKDKRCAIIANKGAIAKEIFQKVKIAYERLPYWMQVGVVEWQKTSCTLENGSSCFSEATTEDGIRGITANVLFLDEFAFVRRSIADAFFTSVYPTISASKESKIIVVSTPNGLNHFHNIWNKAKKGKNTFAPYRVDWWQVPGRDEAWHQETLKNMGILKFNQEYGNEFLGSSATLIKAKTLEALESEVPANHDFDEDMRIWESPIRTHTYVLGVDTAKGTGANYSVVQVLDITKIPFRQVAIWRSNVVSTRRLGEIAEKIGHMYNNAFIMVENNDIGQATTDYLWHDAEYENLVNYDPEKVKNKELGIRSTKKTKSMGLDLLKEFLEDEKLELRDQDTIYELSKFTEIRPGVFAAEEGETDDCVTSLCWGLFVIKANVIEDTDYIYEKFNKNSKVQEELPEGEVSDTEAPVMPVAEGFGFPEHVDYDH